MSRGLGDVYKRQKKIQAAKIFQAGDYWVLVISDNADEISDEITDVIN